MRANFDPYHSFTYPVRHFHIVSKNIIHVYIQFTMLGPYLFYQTVSASSPIRYSQLKRSCITAVPEQRCNSIDDNCQWNPTLCCSWFFLPGSLVRAGNPGPLGRSESSTILKIQTNLIILSVNSFTDCPLNPSLFPIELTSGSESEEFPFVYSSQPRRIGIIYIY